MSSQITPPQINIDSVKTAISKGLDFLMQHQEADGEFATYADTTTTMETNEFDSSPFATSIILYALDFWTDPGIEVMRQKGLKFLLSQMESTGLWRYWSSKNKYHTHLPPDLDDICCISHLLRKYQYSIPHNADIVLANVDEKGRFYTWLVPRSHFPPELKEKLQTIIDPKVTLGLLFSNQINDVDSTVNANVLLYLGQTQQTESTIDYLIEVVNNDKEAETSRYYVDAFSVWYMLSRAYFNGISKLEVVKQLILDKIFTYHQPDGSFGNDLNTALAMCTLFNFNSSSHHLYQTINYLLKIQQTNGAWLKAPMFIATVSHAPVEEYYGSAELTTALCLEALTRYANLSQSRLK